MRGDQLARQWRILQHIDSKRYGLTAAELAELTDTPVRTIYRDLEALDKAGFPLYTEKDDRAERYRFVDDYSIKSNDFCTTTEMMSLYMFKDLSKVFRGTEVYESINALLGKIEATLSKETLAYLDKMKSAFSANIKPYKDYTRFGEMLGRIRGALAGRRRLEIAYHSLNSEHEKIRKIDPYNMWFADGTFYVIAYCHTRKEVRKFVADRMRMIRVTDETFEVPGDFDVDEYMKHSFKVMQGELYTVKIRISSAWSRWVGEKIWHEDQELTWLEDGSLEMEFRVAGLEEIKMWVLGLGREAVVLEPKALKEMVVSELRDAAGLYEKRPSVRKAG